MVEKETEEMVELNRADAEGELPYLYWLIHINGIGRKTAGKLVAHLGNGRDIYNMPEKELDYLLTQAQKDSFLHARKTREVHKEYEKLEQQAIRFIPVNHPDYPKRLKEIPDAPFAVYLKGRLPKEDINTVAIVGARRCSEYGRAMAADFGKKLAEAGIQIISGMASGVDGIAQQSAIEAGGYSLAVLGNGVDICYPNDSKKLYDRLLTEGGILSEYPPGRKPASSQFPPRNRIISGIADCILVIEAKEKSGSLITVDMALEQGKDVYALPGRTTNPLSAGCNKLLKQGAGIILSPEDLMEEMGVKSVNNVPVQKENLTDFERKLLCELDYEPKGVEEIYENIPKSSIPQITYALMNLCMKGMVKQMGMGQYVRAAE